jgi:hypothetical protein
MRDSLPQTKTKPTHTKRVHTHLQPVIRHSLPPLSISPFWGSLLLLTHLFKSQRPSIFPPKRYLMLTFEERHDEFSKVSALVYLLDKLLCVLTLRIVCASSPPSGLNIWPRELCWQTILGVWNASSRQLQFSPEASARTSRST